ncbi:MAG: rRNA pseudouridine synthase [Oscillospiraceae bacterium]|nr:rRNA pseudouridine synthase [Oscillospiraceae bacterium]
MPMMRLDKALADLGIASRRELKGIIRSGRVTVDDQTEHSPERKLDPEKQRICLDGRPLSYKRFHYYMMDKPAGVLTATEDRRQKTVLDLLTPELRRMGLFPVGRLDIDTTGLLLLTDDGEFAHRVISPKSCVEKRYYARVDGELCPADVEAFSRGIQLADGTQCLPAGLEILGGGECLVTVMEGKYHQVKRMLASRGCPVLALRRLSVGGLLLEDNLGPGGFRELTERDLCKLFCVDSMEEMSKS